MIDITKNIQLFNGDCLEVMTEIPNESVDLLLTDPPYGMNYRSSRRTDKHKKIELDTSIDWFPKFIKEIFRVMKNNSHIYIFCNDYAISHFRDDIENIGFKNKRTLVWVKNNHTSGDLYGDYGNKTEFILYAHKGRRLLNGKRDTNVLNFNRVNTNLHPTAKPVNLCAYLINKSSVRNDLVVDCFMGSGTTGVACKQLGRRFIGIELDKHYCEIAQERIKNTTIDLERESQTESKTNKEEKR
jgi:site-specific DNA-methyltransferase (adenine-specific)